MSTLNAQVREPDAKGKQLRREGVIPAVLFGKHLDESISIQIPKSDVEHFLLHNSIGSKVDLMIGKKKYMALLKDFTRTPIIRGVEHLSFQAMTAKEKIASVAHVVLHNQEKVEGLVHQTLSEIHYRALPAHLIEKVEIDLAGKVVGDTLNVGELDFAKNPDIELLVAADTLVFSIAPRLVVADEVPAAEVEAADVPEVEEKEDN